MSDIFQAAEAGDADAIAPFIAADAESAKRAGGREPTWTPIMYLAQSPDRDKRPADFVRAVKLLLDHGADPNDEETPYHVPEGYQNDVLKAIVESGRCNTNSLVTMLLRKHDWHDYEGIRWLLEHGAEPNYVSRWGRMALHQAIERNNRLRFFELLLDHGANPLILDKWSRTSAQMAARYGRADVLDLFRARGIAIALSGWDAKLAAFAHGRDVELDAFAADEIESREPGVLAEFAGCGNVAGVALLLDHGFTIDHRTSSCGASKDTPLHSAIWRGRHEVVRLLLARGAPLEAKNGDGQTPLAYAVNAALRSEWFANRSTTEAVAALLAVGANKSVVKLPTGWDELDALFA